MDEFAAKWFAANTSGSSEWSIAALLQRKSQLAERISVIVPARNEQDSVASVVGRIRADLMQRSPLVDELIVIDSGSTDETASRASSAGARVWSVADIRPDLGVRAGKGEALWKSQFVATGSLFVFIDADLTEWGPHFVTGLLGPLLFNSPVQLVKGFYDRMMDVHPDIRSTEGGRVTELVARPLLASRWRELAAVVQPLAGEWAVRRGLFETLSIPVGYGVELAVLIDTWSRYGLEAIAQVDLGSRGHKHQNVHDLGVMAMEILHVADVRSGLLPSSEDDLELAQYRRESPNGWRERPVPVTERPPAVGIPGYRNGAVSRPDATGS